MTPVENIRRLEALTPFETSSLLKNEHPQIIALTLSILDPNYSGKVLCHFTQRLRNDVVLRVSTIDRVTVRWLNVLSVSIGKTIDGIGEHRLVDLGGSRTAAAMIKTVGELDPYEEVSILDSIREYDPDLALILDETFTFDDLKNLHPAHLSLIFKEVKSEALACALNKTEEPFRGLILGSLSTTKANQVTKILAKKVPVSSQLVSAEQKEILKVVRRLMDEDKIQKAEE